MTVGLFLTGCSSGSSSATTTSSSSPSVTAVPSTSTTAAVPTTPAATTSAAVCPTGAQANAALGGSYSGPTSTPTAGGGIVCEYRSSAGSAAVAVFAHQSATVFAGQVAHAPGAPAMPGISGVGNGAFGATIAGRSIVNAYSNGSRTVVGGAGSRRIGPRRSSGQGCARRQLTRPRSVAEGSRGEDVEAEELGEMAGDQLAAHAVPRAVQTRGVDGQAALAGGNGHDSPADPALAGEAHVVEPVARTLVEAGGGHDRERTRLQTTGLTTCMPVTGFTPPSARVAPITARSIVLTSREHWLV